MTSTVNVNAPTNDSFLIGGDLPVRRIGFGAMRLTDATGDGTQAGAQIWRAPTDSREAIAILRHAVELGVQLIDTADAYALGENEALIAQALHPYAADLAIATKVGNARPSPTKWVPVGRPEYLTQQVELSLRRLRVERIDLLHLHRLDPAVSIAEQVGALAELRDAGKIRHLGLSEVTHEELEEAQRVAPIASVQNLYNLADRHHDPVIDATAREGIAFLPYFPLAIGESTRARGAVGEISQELGVAPAQVALAWLLQRSPNIVPIPGTTSPTHLAQNLGASQVTLTPEQFGRIDRESAHIR